MEKFSGCHNENVVEIGQRLSAMMKVDTYISRKRFVQEAEREKRLRGCTAVGSNTIILI